jgi:hypothetical protein
MVATGTVWAAYDVGACRPSCQLWRVEKQSWVAMVLGSQQNNFKL